MNRPLIVMGDKTTHGGTVISADVTSDINGKYMARVNDMTVWPKCKGTFAHIHEWHLLHNEQRAWIGMQHADAQ